LQEGFVFAGAVIKAEVAQFVAEAVVGDHSIGLFGDLFEVVEGSRRNFSEDDLFGGAASEGGAESVEKLALGVELVFFGQIPGGAQ